MGFGACLLGFLDFLPIGHCLRAAHALLTALLARCDGVVGCGLSEALRVYGACDSAAAQMSLAPAKFETKGDKYDGLRAVWGTYAVAVLETRVGLDA